MKVVNLETRSIDYRLNILGIRVWEGSCQLVARNRDVWSTLGPRWDFPVRVPRTAEDLKTAGADTLRMTAYQYEVEHPGSDLVPVLAGIKDFSVALDDRPTAAAEAE